MLARNLDMRNKITLILLLLSVCTVPVNAHLWGNFSGNNYSRINIEKNQIRLRCVLDMAEIPVFQESQQIDTDKNNALSNEEPVHTLKNSPRNTPQI